MNKEALINRWQTWSASFAALGKRQRLLIALAVVGVMFLLWEALVLQSITGQQEKLNARFGKASGELAKIALEEQVLVQASSDNPAIELRRQISQLNAQLAAADKQVQDMSEGLVSARRLPEILENMLRESSDLQVLGMTTLAPRKLRLGARDDTESSETEAVADEASEYNAGDSQLDSLLVPLDNRLEEERIVGVYRHSVKLTLQGPYFSVVEFLIRLEKMPWRVYWDSIDYSVARYPDGKVQLEVYTLSTEKGILNG